MRPIWRHQLLLLGIGGIVFFTNLGVPRLWDIDEAIFSQVAREMLDRHDAVVPYFNGEVFPHKPVLTYWLMMAAYELFGPTEFAARFWSAMVGLGTVLATYHLGRKLFSPAAGLWAGLVLATNLNFGVIARAATPDSLLTFFSTLAILALVWGTARRPAVAGQIAGGAGEAQRSRSASGTYTSAPPDEALLWPVAEPTWLAYAAAYSAMGLGVLTKGPVGVVLPTAVWGLFLLLRGERRWQVLSPVRIAKTIWSMRPLTAMAVVLAVAGPWYAWVGIRTDGVWLREFFGVHNFGRFLHPMENHRGPIYYYLIAILAGLFPWSIFMVPNLLQFVRRILGYHHWAPGYLLVSSWVIVWVGFFSLASTKLPSYIVPAYPALALITGCFLDGWITVPKSLGRGWAWTAWTILGSIGVAAIVTVPVAVALAARGKFGIAPSIVSALQACGPELIAAGLILLAGATAGLVFSLRRQPRFAAATLAATATLFAVSLFGFAAVSVDRFQTSASLAESIREHQSDRTAAIGSFGYFRPSLVFYTHRPVAELQSAEQARQFFADHPKGAFLVTTDEQFPELAPSLPADVRVVDHRPKFLKPGTILLLGRANGPESAATLGSSRAIPFKAELRAKMPSR